MMRTLGFSREKLATGLSAPIVLFICISPRFLFNRWVDRFDKVVLVYQMGKVASSTVYASLKSDQKLLVLHFHRMPGKNRRDINRRMGLKFRLRLFLQDLQGTIGSILLRRCPEKAHIITMVRDPFSRNISGFFQNFWLYGQDRINDGGSVSPADLARSVLHEYDHEIPLRWFDVEFLPSTGIDVFSVDFDVAAKGSIYLNTRYPLLILRTDLDDGAKLDFLKKFLGRPMLELRHENIGDEKSYADLYGAVKRHLVYPSDLLHETINSRLVKHFFSDQESRDLVLRWGDSSVFDKTGREPTSSEHMGQEEG
jgi:hypothetical protein